MPDMGYTMVSTTPTDDQGAPTDPGAINGGMFKREGPLSTPVITIDVDDIDKALETIELQRRFDRPGQAARHGHGLRRLFQGQRGKPHGPLADRHLTGGARCCQLLSVVRTSIKRSIVLGSMSS